MVFGIIKRLRGKVAWSDEDVVNPTAGVPGDEFEFDFDGILAQLSVARDRAKEVYYRITDEIDNLHRKLHEAIKKHDRDTAEIVAAEMVVKKRHLKVLIAYIKLLEAAISRIKTTRDFTEIAKIFASVNLILKNMESYMYDSPELTAVFAQFATAAQSIVSQTTVLSESVPVPNSIAELDPEVKKLLANAFEEAERETRNLAPSIPDHVAVDYEILENKLLNYLRMTGGVLNVRRAATELGVSPRIIKEVLYRLEQKGIVRITSKTRSYEDLVA
ncbi:MAG: GntR family transcriptional regulator [Crenarchaeota archaeon]|nr:GntR family transcriptional regulator [Thermoproteota archaeon]